MNNNIINIKNEIISKSMKNNMIKKKFSILLIFIFLFVPNFPEFRENNSTSRVHEDIPSKLFLFIFVCTDERTTDELSESFSQLKFFNFIHHQSKTKSNQ